MISESVKRVLKEDFEKDYNTARQNYNRPLWGFEMKNSEGEWQYDDITYDPNTNTMSCMGVSIEVDPSLSVDQNLEGLYEELMNKGFSDGDEYGIRTQIMKMNMFTLLLEFNPPLWGQILYSCLKIFVKFETF